MDILELTSGVQDSGSLPRIVGPPKDFLRGSISNRPFRPGGLDDSQSLERTLPNGVSNGEWARELVNGGPAQFVPPSFKQGLHLGELKVGSLGLSLLDRILINEALIMFELNYIFFL